jgi:homoserine dehydrogenase
MYHDPETSFPAVASAATGPVLRVGLIGLGTGAGTLQGAAAQPARDRAARRPADPVSVATARDLGRAAAWLGPQVRLVADAETLIADPEVDVVVEAVGGTELPRRWLLQALAGQAGGHGQQGLAGPAWQRDLRRRLGRRCERGLRGRGGGQHPHHQGLARGPGCQPHRVAGRHHQRHQQFHPQRHARTGLGFAEALAEAQRLGYAESDPAFDVDGVDAAHKLSLLSAMAFGTPVQFAQAHRGHSRLQARDVREAERLGYRVKLLA